MTRALSLIVTVVGLLALLCCVGGCSPQTAEPPPPPEEEAAVQTEAEAPDEPASVPQDEPAAENEGEPEAADADPLPPGAGLPDSEFVDREEEASQEAAPDPAAPTGQQRLVVIDPGHQSHANTAQEPVGPGASEMKMKVSGGTQGVATGVPEYDLVLTVSLLLREELEARGYAVLLVRETNDVDISNRERADFANRAGADVFLRLHANGSNDRSVSGAMTLCPTPQNPYPIGGLYARCRLLSDCVLDSFVAETGARKERVWETDTMSGLNWCQVPVTLLEMGYMSNPDEDRALNDPAYQARMVQGIANGVDQYFSRLGA